MPSLLQIGKQRARTLAVVAAHKGTLPKKPLTAIIEVGCTIRRTVSVQQRGPPEDGLPVDQ